MRSGEVLLYCYENGIQDFKNIDEDGIEKLYDNVDTALSNPVVIDLIRMLKKKIAIKDQIIGELDATIRMYRQKLYEKKFDEIK